MTLFYKGNWKPLASTIDRARLIFPFVLRIMVSQSTFLYGAAAYAGVHAILFTFKPEIPSTDSFGAEEAKTNRPLNIMTAVCGALFGVVGVTSFCLARGCEAATAVHCGLSVMPIRMAYDAFVEKIVPPPPAIAMTAAVVGAGLVMTMKK